MVFWISLVVDFKSSLFLVEGGSINSPTFKWIDTNLGRKEPFGKALWLFIIATGRIGQPVLAARTGCSILPVAIVNSHRAFPKGSFLPRLVSIHLKVGELIQPPPTRKREDLTLKTKEIQLAINSMLDKGLIKNISD